MSEREAQLHPIAEVQSTKIVVSLVEFHSSNAAFYHINDPIDPSSDLLKIINHEDAWDNTPFSKESVRKERIVRESELLNAYSQDMQATPVIVTFDNSKTKYEAVKMRNIDKSGFFETLIQTNQRLPIAETAHAVLNIISNPRVCPTVANIEEAVYKYDIPGNKVPLNTIEDFLRYTIQFEVKLAKDASPTDEKCSQWENVLLSYITRNADILNKRRELLRFTHGDLRLSNMAVINNAVVAIDPVEKPLWQINDGRMEAGFFYTDLLVHGLDKEVALFWNTLSEKYKDTEKSIGAEDSAEIMDNITLGYRLLVLYSMNIHENHPERVQHASELLDKLTQSLAVSLEN